MKKIILLGTFLVSYVGWAADNTRHNMSEHVLSSSTATQEYLSGMQNMHDGMAQDMDVAFAEGMTADHQEAIDMAETQLKYGKDPEMRKMAEDIIKAQQPKIDQMQN